MASWNVMKHLTYFLLVTLILGSIALPSLAGTKIDEVLTKEIANILKECQAIKPGMARAGLSKVFTTEGGFSTAEHQRYVYRGCPYIKVDVDFTVSDPKQARPTDTIAKISKPFLEWSIGD